jgi:hypothetical protein
VSGDNFSYQQLKIFKLDFFLISVIIGSIMTERVTPEETIKGFAKDTGRALAEKLHKQGVYPNDMDAIEQAVGETWPLATHSADACFACKSHLVDLRFAQEHPDYPG